MEDFRFSCKVIRAEFLRPLPVLPLGAPVTGPIDQYYLPLEYYDNVTLLNLDVQEISDDFMRQMLLQVGLGLDFLHRKNILHRDVHGNGILVNPRNQVKVTNLENAAYGPIAYGFYGSGYAPPEILWLRNFNIIPLYSFHDDVYSLGVVIFIFIYGDFPCTVNGHVVFPFKPIDKKLRHLLESLLHRDRRSRLCDIKSFLEHRFFQREKKEPAVSMVNDSSTEERIPMCVENTAQHSSEENVPLCAQETKQHSSEDSVPLCAEQTEKPSISKSQYIDDKEKLSKKRRFKNPLRKFIKSKPAAVKRTASSTEDVEKTKGKKKEINEKQISNKSLTSPEVCEKEDRGEKPEKEKKSFFRRLVRRMNFLKRREVERDRLVVEEKNDETSIHKFKKIDLQIENQYLQEEITTRKDSAGVAIEDDVKPKYHNSLQQQKEIQYNNMVKIEKQGETQPNVSSNSSSYATLSSSSKGPQEIVKMLKGMKMQEKGQKLAKIIEADETSNISTVKLALPSPAEIARPKKEMVFQKIPSVHKFDVTFEDSDEPSKFENELFDHFSTEKNLNETKASPWLTEKKEPTEENKCDANLDAFQANKNWFNNTLSEKYSVNTSAIWGNPNDSVGPLDEKNDNFNDFFTDDFSQQAYNIESDSQQAYNIESDNHTDGSNEKNKISTKPVEKKKKKHFKWLRNLFSKKTK